jgi:hypothetical protein
MRQQPARRHKVKVISETGSTPLVKRWAVTNDLDTDLRDQTPLRAIVAPIHYRSSRLALPGRLYCQIAKRAPGFIHIFACLAVNPTPLHAFVRCHLRARLHPVSSYPISLLRSYLIPSLSLFNDLDRCYWMYLPCRCSPVLIASLISVLRFLIVPIIKK